MRLYKPIYGGLPACHGRSDEEVERLTRLVYRRKPSLMIYPIVGFILFFIAMWMPRPLAEWTGISMVWALLIVGVVFGIPMVIYERCVHRLAVNKEMDRILADQGAAPNGGPATPTGNSGVAEGPPSVS